jgi:hypothetical protein
VNNKLLFKGENIVDTVHKIFNFKGFLSNYETNKSYFSTNMCAYIGIVNPKKLLQRCFMYNYYYDRHMLDKIINAKILIEDRNIIFSDWDDIEFKSEKQLTNYLKNNNNFYYVEFSK